MILVGSSASGQLTQISGLWYDNRGPIIDIPVNGGFATCAPPNGTGNPGTNDCPRATLDLTSTVFLRQAGGGVGDDPGTVAPYYHCLGQKAGATCPVTEQINNKRAAPLLATGANAIAVGAPFTMPPMFMRKSAVQIRVGVPPSAQVQELQTSLSVWGPVSVHPGNIDAFAPSPPPRVGTITQTNQRKLMPNAYLSQPGRGARQTNTTLPPPPGSQASFTFQLPASYNNGSVQYIKGANGFGGVATMLLSGAKAEQNVGNGGRLWIPLGPPNTTPSQMNGGSIGSNALNGEAVPGGPIMGGGPGRNFVLNGSQGEGPIYLGWNNFNPCPLQPSAWTPLCDLVTVTGPLKTPEQGGLPALPSAYSSNYGFPLTTGTVIVQRTGSGPRGPETERISAMGTDYLTPSGNVRVLQLVAGGIVRRVSTSIFGQSLAGNTSLSGLSLTLPEPGETALLAASLLLVAGLYQVRRRF
jgi:hypothetical protein